MVLREEVAKTYWSNSVRKLSIFAALFDEQKIFKKKTVVNWNWNCNVSNKSSKGLVQLFDFKRCKIHAFIFIVRELLSKLKIKFKICVSLLKTRSLKSFRYLILQLYTSRCENHRKISHDNILMIKTLMTFSLKHIELNELKMNAFF